MIQSALSSLKNETLKSVSVLVGAKVGLRKADRVGSICDQISVLSSLKRRLVEQGRLVVTAVDAGVSNFAYCSFSIGDEKKTQRPLLIDWNKFQLEERFMGQTDKLPLNPHNFALLSERICNHMLELPYDTDLFAIERQRTRTVSSKFVLEPVLRSNILEYLLFSKLQTYSKSKDFAVLSSDPQRMVNYWIEAAQADAMVTEKIEEKTSKKFRIKLVHDILVDALNKSPNRVIELSDSFRDKLSKNGTKSLRLHHLIAGENDTMGAKKDDDLADSFLHSLIWFQWIKNYENLLKRIHKQDIDKIENLVEQLK